MNSFLKDSATITNFHLLVSFFNYVVFNWWINTEV